MEPPFYRPSRTVAGAWIIYPKPGYDGAYRNKFVAIPGSKVSDIGLEKNDSFFSVTGVDEATVQSVLASLSGL